MGKALRKIALERELVVDLRPLLAPALLVVAALLLHVRALGFSFLTFDDVPHILTNPYLNPPSLAKLAGLWSSPYHHLFIPLSYTVWGLLRWIGAGPTSFHATNLCVNAINAVLLHRLLLELLRLLKAARAERAALLGALLFVCSPLQVEAVDWISGLSTLLMTGFGLATLLATVRRAHWVWPALWFLCALLSKPQLVALPLVSLLIEIRILRRSRRAAWLRVLPQLLIAAALAALTFRLQPLFPSEFTVPLWLRPFEALRNLGFYLGKSLVPLDLSADYPRMADQLERHWAFWAYAGGALAVLGAALLASRRRPPLLLACALVVVPLLPVLGLSPFYLQHFTENADRFFYLSMAGLSWLLAWGLATRPGEAAMSRRLTGILAAALLVYSSLAVPQEEGWRNDGTYAAALLSANSGSLAGNLLHGRQLLEKEPRAALPYLEKAHLGYRRWPEGLRSYEWGLAVNGRVADLHVLYEHSLRDGLFPDRAHFGLGLLLLLEGDVEHGTEHLAQIVSPVVRQEPSPVGEELLEKHHLAAKRALPALRAAHLRQPAIECLPRLQRIAEALAR